MYLLYWEDSNHPRCDLRSNIMLASWWSTPYYFSISYSAPSRREGVSAVACFSPQYNFCSPEQIRTAINCLEGNCPNPLNDGTKCCGDRIRTCVIRLMRPSWDHLQTTPQFSSDDETRTRNLDGISILR